MSSVKISELNQISQLNSNTSNTLFLGVDIPTGVTGKLTVHTLAQGLYSNEVLNVGNNQTFLPNTVAQFALAGESYIQTNLVNLNDGGTADIVVTANTGTDSTWFIDMGFANKNYQPGSEFNNIGTSINILDGYLYVQGNTSNSLGGNLIIGTTSSNAEIKFIAGGGTTSNVIAKMTKDGLKMNGKPIYFADGTTQNTAVDATYVQSSFNKANSANVIAQSGWDKANSANVIAQSGWDKANSANVIAQSGWDKANNALANSTGTFSGNLTITGTVVPQKGFIYTPTVYPNAQTAITIDMANNSMVRAQTATGLVVTLSNLLAGKEVVAWITNTAGTNQTFTHGVSALNSTVNATTYNIPGTSTILARYMSIDGTTQNTFVAITK